ncbi:MAG: hypothetical protein COB81_05775 [Flavobacteriaceae bacterium]|nr:MAG: hypothetical protein COB81_05775 [Flavobacteriaceae bacterium]
MPNDYQKKVFSLIPLLSIATIITAQNKIARIITNELGKVFLGARITKKRTDTGTLAGNMIELLYAAILVTNSKNLNDMKVISINQHIQEIQFASDISNKQA